MPKIELEEEAEEEEEAAEVEEVSVKPGNLPIYDLRGRVRGEVSPPKVLATPIRPDVIKRAVVALQSRRHQPQGRDPMAGKRTTAQSLGVGLGIARIPRVKGRGTPRAGQGAFAPGTVGGRLAHPPVAWKNILKHINEKERKLALKSAIAASAQRELVEARGHRIDAVKSLPLVVQDELEGIKRTGTLRMVLRVLGLQAELERVEESRKVRSGKGKLRGRKLKQKKGPLIVVQGDGTLRRAASNIPGVDVAKVESLNAELLAPGAHPGRLTIWSESAFKRLGELFS
ncbi:50S ribosomal protein L4 [Candidatus Hecatella orcuttiae]|jgi:large subunit ribosomal protein L4e|uniref:50S ribosomal protein L4 n=1 Tax=Candidatus Hecatella orcuttiae TaxID=1935119 RepID=UPI002867B7FB|nr:50S ribosomal protein L4 [Candidatus Hecatella orcuttiae]